MLNCRYPVDHLADGVGPAAVHDGDEGPAVPAVHAALHPHHHHHHLEHHGAHLLPPAPGLGTVQPQHPGSQVLKDATREIPILENLFRVSHFFHF